MIQIFDNEQALRLIPGRHPWNCTQRAFILNELGWVLEKVPEKIDLAIAECDAAIRLDQTIPTAFEERGWSYWKKEAFDKAIADLSRAIRLDPHHSSSYGYRADVFVEQHEYDRAIEDFTMLINLSPMSAANYRRRAECYKKMEDETAAKADLDKASELSK